VTLFLVAAQAAAVLADVRANRTLAAVFSQPSTHRTVQLKGADARVDTVAPEERARLAEYREGMVRELGVVGQPPEYTRALLTFDPADLVAVTFTPTSAYTQTPGPNAGAPLSAAPATQAGDAMSPGGEATPGAARPPRSRNRRRRRAAPTEGAGGPAGERPPREQAAPGPRGPGFRERNDGPRQGSSERRDSGPRGDRGDRRRDDCRGGGPGRGRGAGPPRSVERKLYSTDAIVDRLLDGRQRRVPW
jgi:hypothetical protein